MGFYLEAFWRLLYPSSCGTCGRLLEIDENHLCLKCRGLLRDIRFSPADAIVEKRFRYVDDAWTLYPYRGPVRQVLHAIKFSGHRWLARSFAPELSFLGLAVSAQTRYDALVPVPLDRWKYAEREFNQSELIAGLLGKVTGVRVAPSLLRKRRQNNAQSRLDKAARALNVYRAFKAGPPGRIRSGVFLLVDDILTTGSTAEEAAKTLKESGARRVDLVAVARA